MKTFEYDIQRFSLVEKWSSKKQAEQLASLTDRLNLKGQQGWDLLGLHSFDLVGGVLGGDKGTVTLTMWKREIAGS